MKRKNGFTLIELLAVIVILAIISLIATPIILGIIEDTKKDAFLNSVLSLIHATDMDIVLKNYEEEYTYTVENGTVSNLDIPVKNIEGMSGSILYDAEGEEIYAIHNGVYCVKKMENMSKAEISEYVEGKCIIAPVLTESDISFITYRRLCPQPKQKISRFVLEIFYTKHIAFNWLSSYNNYQKKKSIGASVVKLCSRAIRRKSGVFCNEYYRLETRKNQGGFINV